MNNKVLIIEDELILAENLKLYLETLLLEVRIACDGDSAIRLVRESFIPDIIILDFRLPDMPGLQALDVIHQHWNAHSVLMTGNPLSEVSEKAMLRDISYILFKPFPLAELARAIRTLMSSSQEGRGVTEQREGSQERRRRKCSQFPLQMYDGSWIYAERRQPEQADNPDVNRPDYQSTEDNGRT